MKIKWTIVYKQHSIHSPFNVDSLLIFSTGWIPTPQVCVCVSKAHTFELVAAFCCLFLACRPSTRYAIKKLSRKKERKKVRYGNENRRLAFPGRPLSAQVSSRIWSDDGCLNLSSSRLPITQFHPSSSRLYQSDSSSHPISTCLLFSTVL